MSITTEDLKAIVRAIRTVMEREKEGLNRLDAVLGDGDHGTSISQGCAAAADAIVAAQTPADVLRLTATTVMNRMGGSSGALFGTLFLRASQHVKEMAAISPEEFAAMLRAGCEGVAQRGKAQVGDKTMLDALTPAVDTLVQHIAQGHSFADALNSATAAAEAGAASTEAMQAKQGRAKFVGERAIGQRDAGAQSIALLFRAISDYWKDKHDA